MPLAQVIATVKAEAEKDEKRREAWGNYLKKLGGVAATVAALLIAPVIFNMSQMAGNASAATVSGGNTLYYVKLKQWIKEKAEAVQNRLSMLFQREFYSGWPNGGITA
jgi:methenyltetrahydromethanopterin cyclohydrolase